MPKELERTLRAASGRIRRILAVRGICTTLAVFAGAMLSVMAVDAMVTIFAAWIRWLMWGAVVVATVWTAAVALVRPLCRLLTLAEIATLIERNHPELEERLSTAVELAQESDAAELASPELVAAIARAAEEDVGRVSPRREFTARTVMPRFWTVLGAALLLALLYALFPTATSRLVVRALVPSAEVDNVYAGAIHVTPADRVVLAGSSVEITATVDAGFPSRAFVRTSVGGRSESSERMTRTSAEGEAASYSFVYPCVTESLSYRVHCGSALTRAYRLEVVQAPAYGDRRITVEHPAYTGRPADTYTNSADIVGLAGSKVTVSVRPSRPDVRGEIVLADGRRLAGVPRGDRLEFAFELKDGDSGPWRGEVGDSHGFSNTVETASVEVAKDAPPEVKIVVPGEREVRLPRAGVLPLEVEAKDDFRVLRRVIEISVGTDEWKDLRELKSDAETLALSSLPIGSAASFRVRVRAEDNLPADRGGPNVGRSEPVLVLLPARDARSLARQNLSTQAAEAKKAAEEIRRRLDRTARLAESLPDLARDDAAYGNAKRNLDAAKNELANAEQQISDLVDRLKDTRLEAAARTFEEMLEKDVVPLQRELEDVSAAESHEEQAKAGAAAAKEAREAKEAAEEAERRLDALAKKAEEMQRLQDLADREKALADAAESGEASAEEIARAEKGLADELDRELRDEKAQNLENAKKWAEGLKNRAEELADLQDEIRGMSGEEQKIAERKLSDDLRRLEKETNDLRSNIDGKTGGLDVDPNQTSEPVRDAQKAEKSASEAAREAAAALQKDNREKAQENMKAVADALRKASEELANLPAKIDAKNQENAANVSKMEAAKNAVEEARKASDKQAAQDAQKAQDQKSDPTNGQQQQKSQDAKDKPMTKALKRAAEALQKMAREQMEQAELSPESFDAEQEEDSDSEADDEADSDSGDETDSESETDEDEKTAEDTDNREGKGPPSKRASSSKSKNKNKTGKSQKRNRKDSPNRNSPERTSASDEGSDWIRMKGESAREVEDAYDDVPAEYRSLVRDYFKVLNEGGRK